jgi:excisionase family DNA binding protein
MREKSVFTTFEAAKLCHVSPLSIINWVNAGRLPAFRTPGGHRRIRRDDLARFMRENGIPLPEDLRDGSGRPRVLVVDDEASIREVIAASLASRATQPYEVMTAADGFEAGRLVATFRPDVVLLDLRMPGLDGFHVCRTIKADPETSSTIVIALTGYHTPETEARIVECGAVRCLAKPIKPSVVASSIDAVLEAATAAKRRRKPARA